MSDTYIHAAAREYVAHGLSVVPIKRDGSKQPAVPWKCFQSRPPTPEELAGWFEPYGQHGLAVVAGRVSGGLETIDCDCKPVADEFASHLHDLAPELIDRLVVVESPRGRHFYYRCPASGRNAVLAAAPDQVKPGKWKTLVDLKGEGGLVIAPPSGGVVHPSGLSYQFATARTFADLPDLTYAEHVQVLAAALLCDRRPPLPPPASRPSTPPISRLRSLRAAGRWGCRPGDRYETESDWAEILEPHGWDLLYITGDGTRHWTRPGKDSGTSATTGHGLAESGRDLLYVFTTAAPPFEPGKGYTKFTAYALLEHGGDFHAAARAVGGGAVLPAGFTLRSLRGAAEGSAKG